MKKAASIALASLVAGTVGLAGSEAHAATTSGARVLGSGAELRSSLLKSSTVLGETATPTPTPDSKGGEGKCGEGKCGESKK